MTIRDKVRESPPPIAQADFERVAKLLQEQEWIFAKTMPQNPHHYTLRRKWANDADFVWTVELIRRHGYRQKYGKHWYVVLDVHEHFYWTMGAPLSITILINRKPLVRGSAGSGGELV